MLRIFKVLTFRSRAQIHFMFVSYDQKEVQRIANVSTELLCTLKNNNYMKFVHFCIFFSKVESLKYKLKDLNVMTRVIIIENIIIMIIQFYKNHGGL